MLACVVTLRFDPVLGAFDDSPLQEFLRTREVLTIRDHFFVRNEAPYLAMVVIFNPPTPEAEPAVPEKSKERGGTWRAQVSEADFPLFNALRDWRAERAKREGYSTLRDLHQQAAGRHSQGSPAERFQARNHRRRRQGQA